MLLQLFNNPRKGKPIVRWGRKVMDLRKVDRQTAEGPSTINPSVFLLNIPQKSFHFINSYPCNSLQDFLHSAIKEVSAQEH
jgi:hypothetical protein